MSKLYNVKSINLNHKRINDISTSKINLNSEALSNSTLINEASLPICNSLTEIASKNELFTTNVIKELNESNGYVLDMTILNNTYYCRTDSEINDESTLTVNGKNIFNDDDIKVQNISSNVYVNDKSINKTIQGLENIEHYTVIHIENSDNTFGDPKILSHKEVTDKVYGFKFNAYKFKINVGININGSNTIYCTVEVNKAIPKSLNTNIKTDKAIIAKYLNVDDEIYNIYYDGITDTDINTEDFVPTFKFNSTNLIISDELEFQKIIVKGISYKSIYDDRYSISVNDDGDIEIEKLEE